MSSESYSRPARIFLVFADEDQKFRDDINKHLVALRRNETIDDWHEYKISPGSDWQSIDNERLNQADIILLFITPDFIASNYRLYTYNNHNADIRDLAVSPDSRYVASASNDTTVHIWETETGKRVFKYEGHKNEVAAVTWSPDSTRIASACKDGTVHVWQAI